jgi:flagellar hook-basal body complex protein FliE
MDTMLINSISMSKSFNKILDTQNKKENVGNFAAYFNEALQKTNNIIKEADTISNQFAAGQTDEIHKVIIAMEKADIALQFSMQIRNKILDAYNEIMRLQV